MAQLFFSNGGHKEINTDEINKYVDNNYNPGNEKKASHIVLFRNIELLKTGIVLVDLPGVGSMTTSNQETTTRYIKNLYSAIFVIRVNPPITRTEAGFIKTAWYSISNAWFVQNRWNDENDRETEEGLDANNTVLQDIAEKSNIPYSKEIITINAYKALTGVLQNKPGDVAASNINGITEKLEMISANWRENAEKLYAERTSGLIGIIRDFISEEIKKCGLTKEELKAKLKKEEGDFDKTTGEIRTQIKKIDELLHSQKAESIPFIQNLVTKAKENIRVNIYRIADSGVTDGDDLTQAFKDYQIQEFEIVSNEYLDFVGEKIGELSGQLEKLNKILEQEKGTNFTAEVFYKKQQFKWEKGLNAGLKLGGAVAGYFTSIQIGALIGTLIPVPIVGTIVGAVAGLLVAIAISLIGSKSQKLVTAERAKDVKRQIAPVIDDLQTRMTEQLKDSFTNICDNVSAVLDEFCADRLTEATQTKERNIKRLQDEHNTEDLQCGFEDDLRYLAKLEGQVHA